nr:immunoglobulin light chain junction region [Macaca mulatta]MOW31690.1 immunoglobulin light chain junction region [Macaca mulatta]
AYYCQSADGNFDPLF